ncbi:MAG TPA: hypothetical protein VJ739_11475 [Gemmataceae bacterium]|nr:hypothetical protein [Gemmataceae bacterium]
MRVSLRVPVLILVAALVLTGCRKTSVATTPVAVPNPAPAATAPDPHLGGARQTGHAHTIIRRGMERVEAQNQLRQIGVFYRLYKDEMGRDPARLEDFLNYIQRDATREYESLKTGYFVLNLKRPPTPNSVLAYEKEPYTDGTRLVLMGDCAVVKIMSDAEFRAALPAGDR